MISSRAMSRLEDLSEKHGVSRLELMENAGRGMFSEMTKIFPRLIGKKILIVCGHGNNGGDGFVLARYLRQGSHSVNVLFIGNDDRLKKESGYNHFILKKKFPGIFIQGGSLTKYDIIVDAMLGTGLREIIREPYYSMIERVNNSGRFVISVDVPTGLDSDTGEILGRVVNADRIFTLHDMKPGLEKFREKTIVINIGIPEKAREELNSTR